MKATKHHFGDPGHVHDFVNTEDGFCTCGAESVNGVPVLFEGGCYEIETSRGFPTAVWQPKEMTYRVQLHPLTQDEEASDLFEAVEIAVEYWEGK